LFSTEPSDTFARMTTIPAWSEPRSAIVTGGGRGIGLAISSRLAADGAAVAVWDIDPDTAAAAVKTITDAGGRAIAQRVDVADRAEIEAAVADVREQLGAATILVNNAGITPFEKFLDITTDSFDRVMAVNARGTFDCCQVVVPDMIAAGWGRIVNISSSSAQTGSALQVHYAASKGAVIAMTRSLALALGPKGITVNTIPPSIVDTPALRGAEADGFLGAGVSALQPSLPVRRVGVPEDIAAACAYLVRDEAGYITGQVLGVNGGRVIGG
jgi:NAD(P)-dependent dehydrogenase (short-subunit alcohol dehydrogenase family)